MFHVFVSTTVAWSSFKHDHRRLLREKHNDKVSVLNLNKFVPILAPGVFLWFGVAKHSWLISHLLLDELLPSSYSLKDEEFSLKHSKKMRISKEQFGSYTLLLLGSVFFTPKQVKVGTLIFLNWLVDLTCCKTCTWIFTINGINLFQGCRNPVLMGGSPAGFSVLPGRASAWGNQVNVVYLVGQKTRLRPSRLGFRLVFSSHQLKILWRNGPLTVPGRWRSHGWWFEPGTAVGRLFALSASVQLCVTRGARSSTAPLSFRMMLLLSKQRKVRGSCVNIQGCSGESRRWYPPKSTNFGQRSTLVGLARAEDHTFLLTFPTMTKWQQRLQFINNISGAC